LLLTDVIMPEMNGRELADAVIARCPGVKCLFMLGYTDEIIGRHGVLEAGVHFVQKPFTTRTLREAIEQALGGP
ncbi:MAG TPA: hybrid sensor histidine kinase/response regulator, partial [Candidatus Hydrogenedentes bacterium]|nr:hybrid sensor histidine kinase/response regulator [Candidatus Hydrogenedentota bacterium]